MAAQPWESANKSRLAMQRRPGNDGANTLPRNASRPSAQGKSNFLSSAQQLAIDKSRDNAQGGKSLGQKASEKVGGQAGAWALGAVSGGFLAPLGLLLGKKLGGSTIGKILLVVLILLLVIGVIIIIVGGLYAFCDQNRWLLRIGSFVDNRAKSLHDICKSLVAS